VIRAALAAPAPTLSAAVILALVAWALAVPLVTQDPFSLAGLSILDAFTPPVWFEGGNPAFPLGADDQGRDLVTAMAWGLRTSILVGVASVLIGLVLGGTLGLVAGFVGGRTDAIIMRVADVQLAYPALLLAMVIDGIATAAIGRERDAGVAIAIVIAAIGIAFWVQFARTIRASVLVEREQEYVAAARITGRGRTAIVLRHILPNVMAPVLVIATINLGIAIITEATLSFLGIGIPLTHPSLGALIRNGNAYLQSGEWWIAAWPCILLVILVVAVNVLGDHLRDHFNPKIRGRG
jgi:peptide/nickel transport system permease protein